ncbi:hypothetical protein ICL81_02985 [Leucobacter sp. cx-328]|uniref:hypothetical protein n=1 Tax=unclassified Leucobacter TaxID=2621730 RepID=UPI00165EB6EA|nr:MULTISPECIES: hypothetical protein [unclassified Leucobacter]MBC9943492.1 hypothetical protein [Leucobacter sp. cx-328]
MQLEEQQARLSAYELCVLYAKGSLSREQLMANAHHFRHVAITQEPEGNVIALSAPAPWEEIAKAVDDGLLDDYLFEAMYTGWHRLAFAHTWPELFDYLSPEVNLLVVHPLAATLRDYGRVTKPDVQALLTYLVLPNDM